MVGNRGSRISFSSADRDILSSHLFRGILKDNRIGRLFGEYLQEGVGPSVSIEVEEVPRRTGGLTGKMRDTLALILKLSENEGLEVMVIKTYKGSGALAQDVDLLVHPEDYERACLILKKAGASTSDPKFRGIQSLGLGEPDFAIPGMLKIDLYTDLPWRGFRMLDEDFLWTSTRKVDLLGVPCRIPSEEADVLTQIASSLFTDRTLRIDDFIYFGSCFERGLDFDRMRLETEKNGWNAAFNIYSSAVRCFNEMVNSASYDPGLLRLPFRVSYGTLLRALGGAIKCRRVSPQKLPRTIANVSVRAFANQAILNFGRLLSTLSSS